MRSFSLNDRDLQGTPDTIAVLHTHSRRLDYHPHVHRVMPAAALNAERRLWRVKPGQRYLFPHKALAKVFRAHLLEAMTAAGLTLPARHPRQWVVDGQHVGSGEKALVYLCRYLYRGVLQKQDLLAADDGKVTFRYRDAKTKRWQTRTLSGADFLWLLLQHVLPKSFRRARQFGFLHPNSKRLLDLLRVLLKVAPAVAWVRLRPALACPCCGGAMRIVRTRIRPEPGRPDLTLPAAGALAM